MKRRNQVSLSALICTTLLSSNCVAIVHAYNDNVSSRLTENSDMNVSEITVSDTITPSELEDKINYAFETTGADVIITNYVPDPSGVIPYGEYKTNRKSFSFLSYAYTIDIVVSGYLNGGYSVSGFNCQTAVSDPIIVVNSISYYNATTTQARATVYFTLNGEVPHTYRVEAYLLGSITLYS